MADIYRQLQYLADIVAETAKRSLRRIADGRDRESGVALSDFAPQKRKSAP
ncbi:hypothetical protein [Paraburkholderia youngii]|uniref:hypothetical protein n=1 Tax=Paraburkholderia youngii TaxID=2782701 RepID=UPI001595D62A|nr:hypothetical protein [Paraburkholderia youngii]